MRVLVDRGGASNGAVPNGATAANPGAASRRHLRSRVLVGLHGLAALLLVTLVLPRTLRSTPQPAQPAARGAAHPAARECPHFGGSVLDMPDTADCRRLMGLATPCLPHHGQAVVGAAPSAACCQPAAAFFDSLCHCWSSQFGAEALAGIKAVDDACQAASGTTASSGGSSGGSTTTTSSSSSSTAGSTWLTRLRENKAGQGAQPILLASQTDGTAASAGGAAAGAAAGAAGAAGVRLFVGVLSASARREARDAIRASWGTHPGAYRTHFFLARPANDSLFAEVQAEAVQKRDMIVLGHITENYMNISHQTLEVMRFAAADPAVTHVLKVDDDSYVHFDRLLHRLNSLPRNSERLFWGRIEFLAGKPQRNPENQWYVSKEEWPSDTYPPWAHGAGYVLSADLAAQVASGAAFAASHGGRLFKLEDVALASWLEWAAERGNFSIHRVTDRRFNFEGCRFGDLVSHYIRPKQMLCMWGQQGQCRGCEHADGA